MTSEAGLGTTALAEFWPDRPKLLLLGPGCRLGSNRASWERPGVELAPCPWADQEALAVAYRQLQSSYEEALPRVAAALDAVHGTRHGLRYWRIAAGPWLAWYLSVLLDRSSRLRAAFARYPGLATIGVPERAWSLCPRNTLEAVDWMTGDSYNLWLCSRILAALGVAFAAKELPAGRSPDSEQTSDEKRPSARKRLAGMVDRLGRGASLVLQDTGFSKSVELRLLLAARGRIWRYSADLDAPRRLPVDAAVRRTLAAADLGNSELLALAGKLWARDVPQALVEGRAEHLAAAASKYASTPAAVFSANAWYFDEPFKYWSAGAAESGSRLYGTCHGVYGNLAYMSIPSEEHELAIVDRYYTWGWERADARAEIRPLPAAKFVGRALRARGGASRRGKGILYGLTSGPRYLREFPFTPEYYDDYLLRQRRLLRSLSPKARAAVRIRPHRADFGWGVEERCLREFPELAVDRWNRPFLESLRRSALYVCDHCSTTYAEALAAGHPTILVWDPAAVANRPRPDAAPYFDRLREAGVLHETPESAAAAIDAAYQDTAAWWKKPSRQAAVRDFVERYARASPDGLKLWLDELSRAAA